MTENFETPLADVERGAVAASTPGFEAAPLSSEQIVEAVDARIGSFTESIFDADARAQEMGVAGEEADQLVAQYREITSQLKGRFGRAGDMVKGGILGGAIALSGGNALANETGMQGLEQQVAAFASDPNEASPKVPTLTQQETAPIAETSPTEIAHTDSAEAVPQGDDIPEELRTPGQSEEVHAEDLGAQFRASERAYANETPDDRRARLDRAVLQDTFGVLMDTAINPSTKTGSIGTYAEKHGTFIAEKLIPGAGLKHALTGVDEYGENLTGVERLKAFGEGTLELATYGGSKVLKSLGVLWRTGRAAGKLAQNTDASSAARVVSEVARAIPGGNAIKNVADAVEVVTDPTVRAISGPIMEVLKSEAGGTSTPPTPVPVAEGAGER